MVARTMMKGLFINYVQGRLSPLRFSNSDPYTQTSKLQTFPQSKGQRPDHLRASDTCLVSYLSARSSWRGISSYAHGIAIHDVVKNLSARIYSFHPGLYTRLLNLATRPCVRAR